MVGIRLSGVTVRHELLTVRDYNLKRRIVTSLQRDATPPDHVVALDGIDLDVSAGVRLGVLGANGAGKSTLLSVVAGVLAPATGSVRVQGRVLSLLGASGAGLDAESSGVANVIEMGILLGESPDTMLDRLDDIAEFSGLGDRIQSPVYTYSSGMAARLRFSVITSLRPDILVLDEGIGMADAEFTLRARSRLSDFLSSAGILVMASHAEAMLQAQCDEGLWLDRGRIRARGSIDSVVQAYRDDVAAHREIP